VLLKKITIENFRGFQNVTVEFDRNTVLVGENNSGKTSLLEAVRLCLSRAVSRRVNVFEDHDYHLPSNAARPGDAGDLRITLDFFEDSPDDWSDGVVRALGDMAVFQTTPQGEDIRHVTLRVQSRFDKSAADFVTDWDFLDSGGNPMPKAKRPQNLNTLQQLKPVFYLGALRDAATQFQSKSTFWAPFLRNPTMPIDAQKEIEAELTKLNQKVLGAESKLQQVKDNLARAQDIVSLSKSDTVTIDALPTRVWDMLSRAQVNVAGASGASLPLSRHGAGTQSLSVLFLFQAYLEADLGRLDKMSDPLLGLEEPEAHLHPAAIRALWSTLESLNGQKIVATHSGDLISKVPLASIRRFHRVDGKTQVRQLQPNTLSKDEIRTVNFHVRRTRGELIFARCWLLGEGETEYWVFSEAAQILALDLEKAGIRLVDSFAQSGLTPFPKLADDLGIPWHCVVDGDKQGASYQASLQGLLKTRPEPDHISVLPFENMELFLCESGYGTPYERHISPQKSKQLMTAKPGDPQYWEQVVACQPNGRKGARALEAMAEMTKKGKKGVPKFLTSVLEKCCTLASK